MVYILIRVLLIKVEGYEIREGCVSQSLIVN